jgi:zinc D-Ala-D-Ala carboxypeptidase
MVTLSKNFTLTEFTKSQTALRMGIDNTPNDEHLAAAKLLFENVVQPVRDHFGPTVINSGYRGPESKCRNRRCRNISALSR